MPFHEKCGCPTNTVNVLTSFGISITEKQSNYYITSNKNLQCLMKHGDDYLIEANKDLFNKIRSIAAPNPLIYSLQVELWPGLSKHFLSRIDKKKEFQVFRSVLKEFGSSHTIIFDEDLVAAFMNDICIIPDYNKEKVSGHHLIIADANAVREIKKHMKIDNTEFDNPIIPQILKGEPYKFRHDTLASYLDYDENMLADIITKNYTDYVVKGSEKKIYYLNALTLNHVCCDIGTPKSIALCKQFMTEYIVNLSKKKTTVKKSVNEKKTAVKKPRTKKGM